MKYKVNEIAKILGVSTNTIRRFEDEGYITPERGESQYRFYNESDLNKGMIARMYLKCGFSHEEIKKHFESSLSDNISSCENMLYEMDREIERLKFLRHWLKDSIQLMKKVNDTPDKLYIFDNLKMYYVVFNRNGKLVLDKQTTETVNHFLYDIPEIRCAQVFYKDAIDKGSFEYNTAILLKDQDIERFKLDPTFLTNPCIETYEKRKCLLGFLSIDVSSKDELLYNEQVRNYYNNVSKYMLENNLEQKGNILCILVELNNNTAQYLVSIPIE